MENSMNGTDNCKELTFSEEELLSKCWKCGVSFGSCSSFLKPKDVPFWCLKCVQASQKSQGQNIGKRLLKSSVLKCSMCGYQVSNDSRQYPTNPTCLTCEKPLRTEYVIKLIDLIEIEHKCLTCGETFPTATSLKQHTNTHLLKCVECAQSFTRKTDFVAHMKMHAKIVKIENVCNCSVCGRSLPDSKSLQTHMEKEHVCPICGKTSSDGSKCELHKEVQIQEKRRQEKKRYLCTFCGKSFSDGSTFLRHKRYHTGEKPFVCKHCGKGFVASWNLKTHVLMVHNKTKPHKCKICSQHFFYKWQLNNHSSMHTREGEPHFECKKCYKVFFKENELQVHKDKHKSHVYTNVINRVPHPFKRRFDCLVCGKTYTAKASLKEHMYSHINDSEKYKCSTCGKGYASPLAYERHMRSTHGKKIICPICGKALTSFSYPRHKLRHSGVKGHACLVCGKSFMLNDSLTRHMRIHTGEKPFRCSICDVAFSDPSTLHKHKKRLHP